MKKFIKVLNLISIVFTLVGMWCFFGAIGSYELDKITLSTFIYQEIIAFVSFIVAYITYAIKINIKPKKFVK